MTARVALLKPRKKIIAHLGTRGLRGPAGPHLARLRSLQEFDIFDDEIEYSQKVNSAIEAARGDGSILWNPWDIDVSDNNLVGLDAVKWMGPGRFIRHSSGSVENTFTVTPGRGDTNNLYASPDGDPDNDGLSASLPRYSPQDMVDAFQNQFGSRDGTCIINVLPGTTGLYYGEAINVKNWWSNGGAFFIQGTNPDPTGPTAGINVQPLVIFDAQVTALTKTPYDPDVTPRSIFPVGFSYDPLLGNIQVYVNNVKLLPEAFTLDHGTLIGGIYSSATVTLNTPAQNVTVIIRQNRTDGITVFDSNSVRLLHLGVRDFAASQVVASAAKIFLDNIWSWRGNNGFNFKVKTIWDALGGCVDGATQFGVNELEGCNRNTKRAKVTNSSGGIDLDASRARGLEIKNCSGIAFHAKEDCVGHGDFMYIHDNAGGVFFSSTCRMNVTGQRVWRNARFAFALYLGSFAGGGASPSGLCDLGFDNPANANGSANNGKWLKKDKTSNWITAENNDPTLIDGGVGLAGEGEELQASWHPDPDTSSPSGTAGVVDWTTAGQIGPTLDLIPPGSFIRPGTYLRLVVEGRKTGTAGGGTLNVQVGGSVGVANTISATATQFVTEFKVKSKGPSVQTCTAWTRQNVSGATPMNRAKSAVPLENEIEHGVRLNSFVTVLGDKLMIDDVYLYTIERRNPEDLPDDDI